MNLFKKQNKKSLSITISNKNLEITNNLKDEFGIKQSQLMNMILLLASEKKLYSNIEENYNKMRMGGLFSKDKEKRSVANLTVDASIKEELEVNKKIYNLPISQIVETILYIMNENNILQPERLKEEILKSNSNDMRG